MCFPSKYTLYEFLTFYQDKFAAIITVIIIFIIIIRLGYRKSNLVKFYTNDDCDYSPIFILEKQLSRQINLDENKNQKDGDNLAIQVWEELNMVAFLEAKTFA